jgi:hypothetical protein
MSATASRVGSPDSVLAVLSTPPVLATDTRFTGIMSASTNHYTTLVRVDPAAAIQHEQEREREEKRRAEKAAKTRTELRWLITEMTGIDLSKYDN